MKKFVAMLIAGCLMPSAAWAAIAFDTEAQNDLATNPSASLTLTGSNICLVVFTFGSANFASDVTWNGVSLTADISTNFSGSFLNITSWYMSNAPSGTHTLAVTAVGTVGYYAVDYTGADPTNCRDNSTSGKSVGAVATYSLPLTVIAQNSWLVGIGFVDNHNIDPGTGTTFRGTQLRRGNAGDSNGALAAGSQSLAIQTDTGTANQAIIEISIQPPVPAATGSIVGLTRAYWIL